MNSFSTISFLSINKNLLVVVLYQKETTSRRFRTFITGVLSMTRYIITGQVYELFQR